MRGRPGNCSVAYSRGAFFVKRHKAPGTPSMGLGLVLPGERLVLGVAYTSRQNGWRGEAKKRCLRLERRVPTERGLWHIGRIITNVVFGVAVCPLVVGCNARSKNSPDEKEGRNIRLSNRYPRVLARVEGKRQGWAAVQISGTGHLVLEQAERAWEFAGE